MVEFLALNSLTRSVFKECPHPDEKQRMELSRRLNLESRQVKFWFQNRRTQMKVRSARSIFHLCPFVRAYVLVDI